MPRPGPRDPVRNARIDDPTWERTKATAERLGISASELMRDALTRELDRLDAISEVPA